MNLRLLGVLVLLMLLVVGTVSADTLIVTSTLPGNGQLYRSVSSESFPVIRAGAGTTFVNTTAAITAAGLQAHASASGNYISFIKYGWTANTSALPDNAVIDSATFSVFVTSKDSQLGNMNFGLTEFNPTSTTALQISDYNKFTAVQYATSIGESTISANAWCNFTLTNLTFISKTGYTSLATRMDWDTLNSTSGLTWGASKYTTIKINQTSAGKNIPTLTVVYTIPPTTVTYSANATTGTSPMGVALTGSSTGDAPTSWTYYATNVTGNNVEYVLSSSQSPTVSLTTGNYSVKLVGTNEAGSTNSSAAWINVSSGVTTPVASFTIDRNFIRFPNSVTATNTSSNSPTGWNYSWGDGTWTNGTANPSHQYVQRGTFTISLLASNSAGSNTSAGTSVKVFGYDQW